MRLGRQPLRAAACWEDLMVLLPDTIFAEWASERRCGQRSRVWQPIQQDFYGANVDIKPQSSSWSGNAFVSSKISVADGQASGGR